MTASTLSPAPHRLQPHPLLLLIALLTAAPWVARADEVPLLRQGLWEYQRTAGVNKFAATECIDPSEDLRRQHTALEKMGCNLSPALRAGSTYTYTADCSVKLPSGAVTRGRRVGIAALGSQVRPIHSGILMRKGESLSPAGREFAAFVQREFNSAS